ncbi:MAG: HRDC domain-containing protein [Polyangiales bacterium]
MARWIDDPEALAEAVDALRDAPRVAVDCESNAMHAHRARVCVVQLAAATEDAPATEVYLVDTLRLGVGGPLGWLLSPEGPRKVLHDFGYDARILAAEGVTLGNADDTAVLARMLGEPATGLASLLSKRFGVGLDKRFQQHDWARRPLRDDALAYLAGDVSHLGRLYASLATETRAAGIEDEVACETAWCLRRALDDATDEARLRRPPFARIKGFRELRGVARAVLREVAEDRERIAEARDLPIGRVLPNAMALAIARERPTDRAALLALTGPTNANAPWSHVWLDATARGLASPSLSPSDRAHYTREEVATDRGVRKERADRLSAWRRDEAARRGVALQVVLPGHCIDALAADPPASLEALAQFEELGQARRARYGDVLLGLLNGAPAPAPE